MSNVENCNTLNDESFIIENFQLTISEKEKSSITYKFRKIGKKQILLFNCLL